MKLSENFSNDHWLGIYQVRLAGVLIFARRGTRAVPHMPASHGADFSPHVVTDAIRSDPTVSTLG